MDGVGTMEEGRKGQGGRTSHERGPTLIFYERLRFSKRGGVS
jgi:hypothetical protein